MLFPGMAYVSDASLLLLAVLSGRICRGSAVLGGLDSDLN